MSEQAGPGCPECGEPRAADGTPTCSCTVRAADVRSETRTAEAAAAEDFDPVRIRPYVEIDVVSGPADESGGDTTAQHPGVPGEFDDLLTAGAEPADQLPPPAGAAPARRRSRALLMTGVGAAAAVVVTGGVVGGIFWYDSPARKDAVSDGVRAGLPDQRASGSASASAQPSTTASSAQPSTTASSSPSASATGGSATPTGSGTPSATPTGTGTATGAPAPSESGGRPPVLRNGDKGPEVVELQLRLRQVGYYDGAADGTFDRDVENAVRGYQFTRVILQDEPGVYGAATRTSLESETKEP
ncbi:peptidoglycan-binding domain-containing protein [Streptomyces sp. NPDC094149]|uniref:peptidoglycan-binding domain-containing protein n=1 Tax=Streptomyces sp. NPDC094149 TaxID=3155079 RepID=UPI00333143E0